MGILDHLFGSRRPEGSGISSGNSFRVGPVRRGNVTTRKVFVDGNTVRELESRFIAFDVDTTGIDRCRDRIIELGAVLFEGCTVRDRFSTLVNPGISIPREATMVNNITNQMIAGAPGETEAFAELAQFLRDVLCGDVVLCAHNAPFDCSFLSMALSRLGYDASIRYADTLVLSRTYLKGLPNYRQGTVANRLAIPTGQAHRACDDAEVCGWIMCRLIDRIKCLFQISVFMEVPEERLYS